MDERERGDAAGLFARGIQQFNRREFFAAHESWEEIWLASAEPEKGFLQGIIQVAAAFHHYLKGNSVGTRSLLGEGLRKLEAFPGEYGGIRLAPLRDAARRWERALEEGRPLSAEELPVIERDAG